MKRFSVGKREKLAVKLLYNDKSIPEIAEILGVHRSTVWRWFQHQELVKYASWYFNTENGKYLAKARINWLSELDDPDPWKAQRAAVRVLDMLIRPPK